MNNESFLRDYGCYIVKSENNGVKYEMKSILIWRIICFIGSD